MQHARIIIVFTALLALISSNTKADRASPVDKIVKLVHEGLKTSGVQKRILETRLKAEKSGGSFGFERMNPEGHSVAFINLCCRQEYSNSEIESFVKKSKAIGPVDETDWKKALELIPFEERLQLLFRMKNFALEKPVSRVAKANPEFSDWENSQRLDRITSFPAVHFLVAQNDVNLDAVSQSLELSELVKTALERLELDRVRYDHELARHKYSDTDLRSLIAVLWNKILALQVQAGEKANPLQKELGQDLFKSLLKNQRGISEETRIDLIDLFDSEVKDQLNYLENYSVNPGSLRDFVARFVSKVVDPEAEKNLKLSPIAFRSITNREEYIVLCPYKDMDVDLEKSPALKNLQKDGFQKPSSLIIDFSQLKPEEEIELQCGSTHYSLRQKVFKGEGKLEFPAQFKSLQAKTDQVNIVVSLSILNHLSPASLTLFLQYIRYVGGYEQVGEVEKVSEPKKEIVEALERADIFLPIAHQLNGYQIEVAPRQEMRKVHFRKSLRHPTKEGEKLKVAAVVFLPERELPTRPEKVLLSTFELQELFLERSKDRLFVMNISCHSEKTLNAWMDAYKMAVLKRPSLRDSHQVPVVFASQRGFPVNSSFQILNYMDYAFLAIDFALREKNMEELRAQLNQPTDPTELDQRLLRLFGLVDPLQKPESGFDAVSNIQSAAKDLYRLEWTQLEIRAPESGETLYF